MAEVISFDLKKLFVGDFNEETGAISNEVEVSVYKDTFDLVDNEETVTPIYQSGVKAPRVQLVTGDNAEVVAFNIMDTSAASKLFWLGGTVTTVNGKATWHKPKGSSPLKIKSIRAITGDDAEMTIPKGSVTAKKDFKARGTDIFIMPIKVTALDTGFPLIADFTMSDPSTTPVV